MNVTLRCWVGDYEPGTVLDLEPRLGALLVDGGFADPDGGPGLAPELPARAPTIGELRSYAQARGLTMAEAKRAWLEDYEASKGAARC